MISTDEFKDLMGLLERFRNCNSAISDMLTELKSVNDEMGKALFALQDVIEICADSHDDESAQPAEPEEPKTYTFAEVRKAFSAKAHAGFTSQIKALIASYGADKLSAIKKADYPKLMKDLEDIA